jgi:hypothetical protein
VAFVALGLLLTIIPLDEDDEDMGPGENWEPRKRDPDLIEHGLSGLDVLALLVSIYGSTDLFVNEYRSLLADKLLNNLCYNIVYVLSAYFGCHVSYAIDIIEKYEKTDIRKIYDFFKYLKDINKEMFYYEEYLRRIFK